jgi:hypothetical protein
MASQSHQSTQKDPLLQQRAWAALILGLLSLLGIALIGNLTRAVYVLALTFVFGGLAAWLGVTALSRARRGGSGRPRGALGGVVLGVMGLAFSALLIVGFAVLWPQISQLSTCLAGANTQSARQACQTQFTNSVSSTFGVAP